jgi:hypothetical protein
VLDDDVSRASDEGSEWGTKELELLYDAVQDELHTYNAIGRFGLADEAIRTLAWAVTSRIDYAFRIEWSPDWVRPGRPHLWKDEDGWHARCDECAQESRPSASEHDAIAWFDGHAAEMHDTGSTGDGVVEFGHDEASDG